MSDQNYRYKDALFARYPFLRVVASGIVLLIVVSTFFFFR